MLADQTNTACLQHSSRDIYHFDKNYQIKIATKIHMSDNQPWNPATATEWINRIAKDPDCDFSYTFHVRQRISERNLIVSDILFVLRHGFVYKDPEPSTISGLFKYTVESQSPNSGAGFLRIIAVPDEKSCQLKVITAMWRDHS